jgi:hypothetical protein
MPPPPFTCPRCGRTSHHPDDSREGYCGACHDFTGQSTEQLARSLRLRLWIGGVLRDTTWIDAGDPNAAAKMDLTTVAHNAAVERANAAGQAWMIEVWDPEMPRDEAFLRFGTDAAGMTMPVPFGGEPINGWPS